MTKHWLHITNGDSASNTIEKCGVQGQVLPWRDVLHDGPVPGHVSRERLSDERARFLADPLFGGYQRVRADFAERDELLNRAGEFDEVVLWFEHDLYDQLQILQILDWLAELDLGSIRLSMICIDAFPGIEPFYGIGQLDQEQMFSLFGSRRPITDGQLALGREAWKAFVASDPSNLVALRRRDLPELPFLAAALARFVEDYPALGNGLSVSEQRILQLVDAGESRPGRLFPAWQEMEAAPFLGDWGFWHRLDGLAKGDTPLLICGPDGEFRLPAELRPDEAFLAQRLSLTEAGRAVMVAEADAVALNGLDRWYGGVHLVSGGPLWRWDASSESLVTATG